MVDNNRKFESVFESSDEDKKQDKSKKETQKSSSKRQSLLERLTEKNEAEGEKRVTLKSLLESESEKSAKEANKKTTEGKSDSDTSPDERDAPEADSSEATKAERYRTNPELEQAVARDIEDHISERLALLNNTVESSDPTSVEHQQAEASKQLLEAVDARLKSGEVDVNPVVEAEYLRIKELVVREANEDTANQEGEIESQQPAILPKFTPVRSPSSSQEPGSSSLKKPVVKKSSAEPIPLGSEGGGPKSSARPPKETPVKRPLSSFEAPSEKSTGSSTTERSTRGQDLLTGGVVGYLFGRHRGRKRTEARLQPKINDLEKEVSTARKNLSEKEASLQRVIATSTERSKQSGFEAATHTQPKPVREVLRRSVDVPEYLQNETVLRSEAQIVSKATKQEVVKAKLARLDSLSTPEILAEAQHMYAGGTSVRRLYETNQIDRKGLIYLVKEGYRGKDIRGAFEKVELGRERQRERAREFRHDDPGFTAPPAGNQQSGPVLAPLVTPTALPNQPDQSSVEPILPASPTLDEHGNTINGGSLDTDAFEAKRRLQSLIKPLVVFAVVVSLLIILILF